MLILAGSHHIDAIAWQQETSYSDNVIDAHRDGAFVFRHHCCKRAACTVFREQGCHQHLASRDTGDGDFALDFLQVMECPGRLPPRDRLHARDVPAFDLRA